MDPSDCPEPWVHSPKGVKVGAWRNTPIHNVWKNEETGEVLVQFSVHASEKTREYVEVHVDGEKVRSRLRRIANTISRKGVEFEFEEFVATEGSGVDVSDTRSGSLEAAMDYMSSEA